MNTTIIRASIHVSPDCDIDIKVDKLKTNDKKYAFLTIGDATIFLYSHDKALEIAKLLEQAAQELEY